jgi:hypothetical protein
MAGELLADAGFELTARHALPLDVYLLTADKAANGGHARR